MALFVKRATPPSANNRYWTHYKSGQGSNYCIPIVGSSVLPNCVGYAWGRWSELLNVFHNLSRGNAENWWGKDDGYERSSTPRLGSVVCWRGGQPGVSSDGLGHVAIVEEIHSDGSILISASDYGGSRFYTKTLKPPYTFSSKMTFQGFIHLPVKMEVLKSNQEIVKEVLAGKWGNGQDRTKSLRDAGYNPKHIQQMVNEYDVKPAPTKPVLKSNAEVAKEVSLGLWGNGLVRIKKLKDAGYDPQSIQDLVNGNGGRPSKTIDSLVQEIKLGLWGNGQERIDKLKGAGYDPKAVQARVDQVFKKSDTEIAKEVLAGKWGNGQARVDALKRSGYDPSTIQSIVNRL